MSNEFSSESGLSAEKSELLKQLLREEGIEILQQPISPRDDSESLPLSFAQQRLWFLEQLQPDNPTYNVPAAFRLAGELDVGALQRSLDEIVRRHEALRTTFAASDGEPVQIVSPSGAPILSLTDLSELSESERESEVQSLATREAQRPFDLSQGPLLRATLLRLGREEHVLLLTVHHIVFDGWSTEVFFRELTTLYEAYSSGEDAPLDEPPVQYADYAIWQRERLQGEVLDEQLSYWRRQLDGAPAVLELPTDRPRPPVQSFRGAYQSFTLSEALSAKLRDLSRREGATLYMTLLAAFQTVLYRYTGQEDVLVGTPIAGRTRPETEELIGFFANTLIVRTDLSGEPTFRKLLARVRTTALEAYSNQDLPFERLVEELQPERDLGRNPLFQVMFAFQNASSEAHHHLPGLTVSPLEVDSRSSAFDITLSIEEIEQGLMGVFEYSTDLFDAPTIARMAEHVKILLESVVAHPERRISTLPLLTEDERHRLLVEWNRTQTDYPREASMHQLFEEQVERTPDGVALVFEDERLSYDQLNAKANQLAHHLRKLGVGPEIMVGICVERSVEMVVGLLGVLKAGGAYVPLDPSYPMERLSFVLEDTRAPVLLTRQHYLRDLPEHSAKVVCLDTDQKLIAAESEKNPTNNATSGTLAYAIYTSGSTGEPSGVLVEHGGLCNLVTAQAQTFGVRPDSRVLQFASLSFDGSIFEVLALLAGATLCLASRDSVLPGPALTRLLRDQAITNITLPPSALAVLPAEKLPALQTIIVAGEACPAKLVGRWAPNHQFFNGYGPTEVTVCATATRCTDASAKPPIGRPIANKRVYLLDKHLQPVPIGVPGELHVGGVGLARGYLNHPGLTAERFITDPFADERGARLYKTGDLARYLPDGNIEFIGRMDHQMKVRGFRVEPGEIEAVLSRHPSVQETVVVAREDRPDEKRLVAYVVPERGRTLRTADLRGHLNEKLPSYMVPSAFVEIEAIPITPNGKVDRRALPTPGHERPESPEGYAAPRTPVEEALACIWAEVLGIERVGIYDDFFELGGHSLQLARLVSRISSEMNFDVPIRLVFTHPSVSALAAAFQETPETDRKTDRTRAILADDTESAAPPDIGAPGSASPFTAIERRPLLPLFAVGKIDAVDAVAFGYLPDSLLDDTGLSREEIVDGWYDGLPLLDGVVETDLGRIAGLTLPRFDSALYSDPKALLDVTIEALEMSRTLGARTVSLTGILASATDYGRTLQEAAAGIKDLPAISTGHATTTASVVLSVSKILETSGRNLGRERVAFLGLGSIGIAVLRLMLRCLPHPAEIRLSDVYGKLDHLQEVRRELVEELGFRGDVKVIASVSRSSVPPELYDATLIVGATNVPDVLDIDRVSPGTLIVDDSGPHCFSPEHATERFRAEEDILFTEGGVLRSPHPVHEIVYLPRSWEKFLGASELQHLTQRNPYEITGCVLSPLLSSRFEDLRPTVGLIEDDTSLQHYGALGRLGFGAADLHCEGYVLPQDSIQRFRRRFGR